MGIREHYAATSILMYIHGCNQKCYSMYFLSYSKNKMKFLSQETPKKKDIH